MRRRSREISVFNLSMLDVIAGAMAAFLILVVILLPYYEKDVIEQQILIEELQQTLVEQRAAQEMAEQAAKAAQAQVLQIQEEMAAAQADLAAIQAQSIQAQAELATAEKRAREAQAEAERLRRLADQLAKEAKIGIRPNLVLHIYWDTRDVVDLRFLDRKGEEPEWSRTDAQARKPSITREGSEIWLLVQYPAGDLQVDVQLTDILDTRKPVTVKGRVIHNSGSASFPELKLYQHNQRERIATIRVDDAGRVTVR